jgi:hypothetical protein
MQVKNFEDLEIPPRRLERFERLKLGKAGEGA